MNSSEYLKGVADLYQSEVLGEAFFSRMASLATTDEQRHKFYVLLQLETETKARLRPFVAHLGLSLVEDEAYRIEGTNIANTLGALQWPEFVTALEGELSKYVARYEGYAAMGPESDKETLHSMVVHERSLLSFAREEMAGNGARSLDAVLKLLKYPFHRKVA
jgi:hypothetical protein